MRCSRIPLAAALLSALTLAACNTEPTNVRKEVTPPSSEPPKQGVMAPEHQQKAAQKQTEKKQERDDRIAKLEERGIKPLQKRQTADRKVAPTARGKGDPKGNYYDYDDGAVDQGKVAVLFFYASWSPKSEMDDRMLHTWYMGTEDRPQLSVYKVDMDAHKDLADEYKVTDDHTYVKLDPHGRMMAKVFSPSAQELRDFLNEAHPG